MKYISSVFFFGRGGGIFHFHVDRHREKRIREKCWPDFKICEPKIKIADQTNYFWYGQTIYRRRIDELRPRNFYPRL